MTEILAIPENTEALARLLVETGKRMWDSQLHGCNAESRIRRCERMQHPQPGDWVYEQSSAYMFPPDFPRFPAVNKVGVFLRETQEPVDPWTEPDEPAPMEKCIYIRLLDGREYRWTNARVVAFYWEPHTSSLNGLP